MGIPHFVPRASYEHPDGGDNPRPDPFVAADFALTRAIAEVLERHYFGQPFKVQVSHEQGVAMIQIPLLMGSENWWVVHISTLNSDPGMKCVIRAGGEILERYKIPRCAFDREAFIAAHSSVPLLARLSGRGFVPS